MLGGGFFIWRRGGTPMDNNKKEKKQVDEAMVDKIVEESKSDKNLKEKIYDQINIPIWLLDIVIVGCIAALIYIIVFKRA